MGIKHFYSWFRKHEELKKSISSTPPGEVDHLLIDMNGVIHEAAQRVYKYGKYAPTKSTIIIPRRRLKGKNQINKQQAHPTSSSLVDCVKDEVNRIIKFSNPRKTVFLGIDGVAPKSKQNQQRQRRFRAAKEREKKENDSNSENSFDSTSITAGTEFMWDLSQKLYSTDWICSSNKLSITFSDDSIPGEGEHKLVEWIRDCKDEEGTYCVAGMDADLILLCCALKKLNIYIMREDEQRNFDYIDINQVRQDLPVNVDDLIIWSCFIGNDFLPPIPSLEIKESGFEIGALDFLFKEYRRPLIDTTTGELKIEEIKRLLGLVAEREQSIMEERCKDENDDVNQYNKRFPNPLWTGDIEQYRINYYEKKLKKACKKTVVYSYMKTVQWVYFYYIKGIQSWDWFYPYNYTLHADDFTELILPIVIYGFKKSKPSHPHEQLLRVIPPSSKYLIPSYLHDEMDRLAEVATTFEIDKAGKRQEWEAITIVDFVNPQVTNFR
jgi:5'-3' exoribonuclease 1